MNISTGYEESTRNYLNSLPVEIKHMIAQYLPVGSLVNFKMSSKALNYNYQFNQWQLDELYNNQKLFNSDAAFKCYLHYKEPIGANFTKAINKNMANIVNVLLEDGRLDPCDNDNYAIQIAAGCGYTEIVQMLLNDGRVDPSADNNYSIRGSCENGHIDIVKMLLNDKRVDPSVEDNYAMKCAAGYRYTEIVRILLADERVDPTVEDNYAIRMCSQHGCTKMVKMLLEDERIDPSAVDNYAIRFASENGHTEIVKMLLDDKRLRISAATVQILGLHEQVYEMIQGRLADMQS